MTPKQENVVFCCFLAVLIIIYVAYSLINYIVKSTQAKLVGPRTADPIVPFSLFRLSVYRDPRNTIRQVKILHGTGIHYDSDDIANGELITELTYWMVRTYGLESTGVEEYCTNCSTCEFKRRVYIPSDVRIISVRMDGFKHGSACHQFIPKSGRVRESHYEYQMFGNDKIQVTYYVENGVSYVAGFCIYINYTNNSPVEYNMNVIDELFKTKKYPVRRVNRGTNPTRPIPPQPVRTSNTSKVNPPAVSNEILIVRYCNRLQRHIMSSVVSCQVVHHECNPNGGEMKKRECEECTKVMNDENPPEYSSLSMV